MSREIHNTAENRDPSLIPWRLNFLLFFFFLLTQSFVLFFFPRLHGFAPISADLLLLFGVFASLPSWYLTHEAVHVMLHPQVRLNNVAGRTLSVANGVPFAGLKHGHLLHHRFNRVEDLAECYDSEKTNWAAAYLQHLVTIIGGFYWGVFIGSLVLWLPVPLRNKIEHSVGDGSPYLTRFFHIITRPHIARENRFDAFLCLLLYGLAFWAYGPLWRILLVALLGRALLVSLFDNSFHYETPRNPVDHPEHARNHAMAFPWLILNFNHHQFHHYHPNIPWIHIADRARQEGATFEGGYFYWALRQLRGPIPLQVIGSPPLVVRPPASDHLVV